MAAYPYPEGEGSYYNSSFEPATPVPGFFTAYNVADIVRPSSSPFYAFAAETGYGGGDASLSSLSNAGYGGGYFDTGSGLGGGPSLESFVPGMDAIPDSLIFNPNTAPTTPWFSIEPIVSQVDYSSPGSDYPLAFMFLPSMGKQPTEFDTPHAYFEYLRQDQFWRAPTDPNGQITIDGRPAAEVPEYMLPPDILPPRDPRGGIFVPQGMAPGGGPGRSLPPGFAAPDSELFYTPRIPGYGPQKPFYPNSDEWMLEHHPPPVEFDQ